MLQVQGLYVEIDGRRVLQDVNLEIGAGETHVLFGPNGSGKTSFIGAIMGLLRYKISAGRILYKGQDITFLSSDERARRGIAMLYQRPPSIRGLSLRALVDICMRGRAELTVEDLASRLQCSPLLPRDVNVGFSGGEIKKTELFQLLARRPDLALIDEPDSGVDLDNLMIVGKEIAAMLDKGKGICSAAIMITHTGHILNYVHADIAHVMMNGTLTAEGDPHTLLDEIRQQGYQRFSKCETKQLVC